MEKTREFTVNCDIKMVAVDVDGTFVHSDYTYDIPRDRMCFPLCQVSTG